MTGAFMVDSLRGARRDRVRRAHSSRPIPGLQILDRPANGVGVVALHIAVIFRNDAAGEGVASRAVALQHAMAVAEHFNAVVAVKAAAFGVGDAFIGLQGRLLPRGRPVRWRRPGRPPPGGTGPDPGRQRPADLYRLRRQAGRGGIAGDIQRRLHGAGDGVRAKIGGGGAALAVLMVNRDA